MNGLAHGSMSQNKELSNTISRLANLYHSGQHEFMGNELANALDEYPDCAELWNIAGGLANHFGEFELAIGSFTKALELSPNTHVPYLNLGLIYQQLGNLETATEYFTKVLEKKPNDINALNSLGNIRKAEERFDEAIDFYNRGLEIDAENFDLNFNAAIVLQSQGRLTEAVERYNALLSLSPDNHQALFNLGTVYLELEEFQLACEFFRKIVSTGTSDAEVHYNFGCALMHSGKSEDATEQFHKTLELEPNHLKAFINLGEIKGFERNFSSANQFYLEGMARFEAANTPLTAIEDLGDELKKHPMQSTEEQIAYATAKNNLGVLLQKQDQSEHAIAQFKEALAIEPENADTHHNLANTYRQQKRLNLAARHEELALQINPELKNAKNLLVQMYREMANWTGVQKFGSELTKLGISGDSVSPFTMLLAEDNPANQLARSINLATSSQDDDDQKASSVKTLLDDFVSLDRSGGKLRLGYFSSDFRDHPVLHLLMGMLREHDRSSFELYGYSSGRVGECAMREEAKGYFDVFTDINEMSDADVVKLARGHQLDAAINLSGYTYEPRNGVFAHRVAPVQINYLGYPSTMGADFMDYIVADKVIIPEEYQQYYSEKVLYLPDVYLPNDDKREVANTNTSRSDFGLPEDGFVFCCFNSSYKISPAEFDVWMRILGQVEGSVLWLSNSNKWAVENLKKEAEKRGVSADRIIFASRLEKNSEHLARHKHADLFIDTFNYNAHTTAGDALMTGLPLVTKQGEQFAARVASSLLHALDLDELVTRSVEEYEALILELATKPEKLKAIKAKLAKSLTSKPVFDTKTYTQNFENIIHHIVIK